jgi:DNA polymerase V
LVGITDVASWQLSLNGKEDQREKKVDLMREVDRLNTRYGKGTVWQGTEARSKASWQSKSERRSPRYTTQLHELPELHR